jgi:hypothetical protein
VPLSQFYLKRSQYAISAQTGLPQVFTNHTWSSASADLLIPLVAGFLRKYILQSICYILTPRSRDLRSIPRLAPYQSSIGIHPFQASWGKSHVSARVTTNRSSESDNHTTLYCIVLNFLSTIASTFAYKVKVCLTTAFWRLYSSTTLCDLLVSSDIVIWLSAHTPLPPRRHVLFSSHIRFVVGNNSVCPWLSQIHRPQRHHVWSMAGVQRSLLNPTSSSI